MKKIFVVALFLLSITSVFAQSTDAALTTQANVIRNETAAGGNTKTRVANMFQGLIDSKVSILNIKTVNGNSLVGTGNIVINSGVWGNITGTLTDQADLVAALLTKQATLISGTNIKTVNGTSLLGSGNVSISTGVWGAITGTLSDQTDLQTALDGKVPTTRTVSTTSPLSGGGALSSNLILAIQNAAADGSTKGAASFSATYFDATSGNITPDLTNGLASGSQGGWLSSSSFTTFNGKQDALVSGTNIKTVNSNSLLGSGNVAVGDALVANPLSQFASTTSAQLAGVLTDETGTGSLVLNTSPAFLITPTAPTAAALTSNTQLATTGFVRAAIPFVTPEDYGAVGDGVTNDASALQSCITTGKCVLGAKTYLSNTALTMPSGGYLIGVGNELSVIQFTTSSALTLLSVAGNNGLHHFKIKGPNAGASGSTQIGIAAVGLSDGSVHKTGNKISNMTFENVGTGVYVIYTWTLPDGTTHAGAFVGDNLIFKGSYFRAITLDTRAEFNNLTNIQISGAATDGIFVRGGNNVFENGYITNSGTAITITGNAGDNSGKTRIGGFEIGHNTNILSVTSTDSENYIYDTHLNSGGITLTSALIRFNSVSFGLTSAWSQTGSTVYVQNSTFTTAPTLSITGTEIDFFNTSGVPASTESINASAGTTTWYRTNPLSNTLLTNHSGTVGDANTVLGLFVFSTGLSHRATSSDIVQQGVTSSIVLTSGATNQTAHGFYNPSSYTINHTGYTINGYYFNPTISGTQASAANVYAFRASAGNFVLGTNNIASARMHVRGSTTATSAGLFRLEDNAGTARLTVNDAGNTYIDQRLGIGVALPSARLELMAGTTAASSAPLKFDSGPLLTTPETGAMEFLTDKLYSTITTGTARKEITMNDASLTSGTIPVATTNGRLTDSGFTTTNLASGTYSPSLTNTTNVSASTAYVTGYYRIGNSVTVYGKVDIDVTLAASTATELNVSLPIASNMTADEDLGGTAISDSVASLAARIKADATNDRASIVFKAISLTNDSYSFEFSYQVK